MKLNFISYLIMASISSIILIKCQNMKISHGARFITNASNIKLDLGIYMAENDEGVFVFFGNPTSTKINGTIRNETLGLGQTATYEYHIHEKPVTNGSCASTEGHFNPTNCTTGTNGCFEVGDLSGKFGSIVAINGSTNFGFLYNDSSLTLATRNTRSGSYYIGDRSIVIDGANKSRIACANISQIITNTFPSPAPPATNDTNGSGPSPPPLPTNPTSAPNASPNSAGSGPASIDFVLIVVRVLFALNDLI
jgi:hypothetical protein